LVVGDGSQRSKRRIRVVALKRNSTPYGAGGSREVIRHPHRRTARAALGKRVAGASAEMLIMAGVLRPERGSKPHESR
jgi:hypothetical protein